MKKAMVIIFLGVFFLIGLSIGGNYHNSSHIFEDSLDHFEEEIQKPNNDYNVSSTRPKSNLLNKIASKIDSIIDKIAKKLT